MTTYHASWLFTEHEYPTRDAVLQVEAGKVVYAGTWEGQPVDVDFGNAMIVPGFVNAHTHLDLGGLRLPQPQSFTEWLGQVVQYRRSSSADEWEQAIAAGIAESLRHGTTAIGDISAGGLSWPLLEHSGLRFVHFFELIGLSDERCQQALDAVRAWQLQASGDPHQRGYSPHAPYTVSRSLLNGLVDTLAGSRAQPIAMHLAESREELQLLREQAGPFESFLIGLDAWLPQNILASIEEIIYLLNRFGSSLVIHGNYLRPEQWQRLSRDASVVFCPRTHHYFCHEPHPYLDMLAEGINVALGTDSLASNPDLSILNECRFLWQRDRDRITGASLLKLATTNGHRALRITEDCELFSPGCVADFAVIPCDAKSDPWEQLFGEQSEPVATFVGGRQLFPILENAHREDGVNA
jgi:aminodeoxyfutalosine deaminase